METLPFWTQAVIGTAIAVYIVIGIVVGFFSAIEFHGLYDIKWNLLVAFVLFLPTALIGVTFVLLTFGFSMIMEQTWEKLDKPVFGKKEKGRCTTD